MRGPSLAAASLCVLAIGLAIAFAPVGAVTPEPWRQFGLVSAVVAGGASAVALWTRKGALTPAVRRLAAGVGATLAGVAMGAGSDAVANKPDAVALPFYVAGAGLAATLIQLALRRLARGIPSTAIAVGLFLLAAYLVSTRLDPVIVGPNGSPSPRFGPFLALVGGAAAGLGFAALPDFKSLRSVLLAGAAGLVAIWGAGLYGIATAAVGTIVTAGLRR